MVMQILALYTPFLSFYGLELSHLLGLRLRDTHGNHGNQGVVGKASCTVMIPSTILFWYHFTTSINLRILFGHMQYLSCTTKGMAGTVCNVVMKASIDHNIKPFSKPNRFICCALPNKRTFLVYARQPCSIVSRLMNSLPALRHYYFSNLPTASLTHFIQDFGQTPEKQWKKRGRN